MNSIAVISLTERGRALSVRIRDALPYDVRRFSFYKHTDEDAEAFDDLSALVTRIFTAYDALVFLCACGIAVRMTAPHIRSKQSDPAVIAVDDRGQYVIPLLSGHLGGANALAGKLADVTGGLAVITTATDIGGQFSPDSFAKANGLLIAGLAEAKEIAAAVLNGETIGLHCSYPYRNLPPELTVTDDAQYGIVIADSDHIRPYPVTLHLSPRNIVAGIGCKKGTSVQAVADAVQAVFAENGLSAERICKAASIDLKAREAGLLRFCADQQIPLQTFSADELMRASGCFSHSDFAQTVTGADNICERSAVLCSGGALVIRKTALNGVTVAAAEIPVEIDFEKRML
ncbi:MAG: cobalt-precorrin 5A hydrolase [Oscillospiraceae bacterium]|nr:cobalt-precorrin 5A hydrolase [Oscillospiraceae bacterium]